MDDVFNRILSTFRMGLDSRTERVRTLTTIPSRDTKIIHKKHHGLHGTKDHTVIEINADGYRVFACGGVGGSALPGDVIV